MPFGGILPPKRVSMGESGQFATLSHVSSKLDNAAFVTSSRRTRQVFTNPPSLHLPGRATHMNVTSSIFSPPYMNPLVFYLAPLHMSIIVHLSIFLFEILQMNTVQDNCYPHLLSINHQAPVQDESANKEKRKAHHHDATKKYSKAVKNCNFNIEYKLLET